MMKNNQFVLKRHSSHFGSRSPTNPVSRNWLIVIVLFDDYHVYAHSHTHEHIARHIEMCTIVRKNIREQ